MREDIPERQSKADRLGFLVGQTEVDNGYNQRLVNYARAVEFGRAVGRDIGGGDPERMAPPRVAEYVEELFKGSNIKVNKIEIRFSLIYDERIFLGQCCER